MENGLRLVFLLVLSATPVLCLRNLQWGDDGTCLAPDGTGEVECCDTYEWDYDDEKEFCKPLCIRSCGEHGECVLYDHCKCDPPYEFRDHTCLLPVTNETCTGSTSPECTSPRISPECKQPCINSVCVATDKCECLEGYTRKNQWECTPVCKLCTNGECIEPGNCKCNKGYFKQGDKCVPFCEGNCTHGYCWKPGECACEAGYKRNATDRLTCHPMCNPGCVNGTCVEPNKCSCTSGYTKINSTVCQPKCDQCSNGECIGPNQCICHKGYRMIKDKKCKPACSKACVHGYCSEPEKCTCDPGYDIDATDKFKCNPICESCENGHCTKPGECSCNDGYEIKNGTCSPKCSQKCINGYCKLPNVCGCSDGFKMNSTLDSSVCYKPCRSRCDNGICNFKGECICLHGYSNDTGCHANNNETIDCKSCEGNCTEDVCKCSDGRYCEQLIEAPRTGLAGLELTWILGACIGILLFIFVIGVMGQMYRKRPSDKTTYAEGNTNGSVGFTAPGTLILGDNRADEDRLHSFDEEEENDDKCEQTSEGLLHSEVKYEDERL